MHTRLVLEVMTWNAAKSSFLRQHAHCAQGDSVGLEFRPPPLFLSLAPVLWPVVVALGSVASQISSTQ
jgi:hypothetical protein